jgi:NLI interacting factor-like phosphatase
MSDEEAAAKGTPGDGGHVTGVQSPGLLQTAPQAADLGPLPLPPPPPLATSSNSSIPQTTASATHSATSIGIPEPTQDYILATSLLPRRSTSPTAKLIILDLNGTLVYRPRNPAIDRDLDMLQASTTPILRPHLQGFMAYIFDHFRVMFWSSATPRNVKAMIAATTTPEQRVKITAMWARDTLGLSPEDYNQKSVTYKDLRKVFADKDIAIAGERKGGWDIDSTILLDDSARKASFQPYNHVCLPEFVNSGQDDALWQVAGYLEELRHQDHVARFIKQKPFKMGAGWGGECMALAQ